MSNCTNAGRAELSQSSTMLGVLPWQRRMNECQGFADASTCRTSGLKCNFTSGSCHWGQARPGSLVPAASSCQQCCPTYLPSKRPDCQAINCQDYSSLYIPATTSAQPPQCGSTLPTLQCLQSYGPFDRFTAPAAQDCAACCPSSFLPMDTCSHPGESHAPRNEEMLVTPAD